MIQEIRLANRSLTLRRRRDVHFTSTAEEQRAENARREFLAGSFDWTRDQALMSKLKELLSIDEADPSNVRWKVQRAFELGDVVTIPDRPSSGLRGGRDGDAPRPRSATFTPSQLFKGAPRITRTGSYYDRPVQPRLFADDCMAAWLAKPGDLLSDGGGETMLDSFGDSGERGSMLGDARPLEYAPDELSDDSFDIAASTNNPNYAAKMLGYDRNTFGDMIHAMKYDLDLRGDDNVIWHDNGDIEFKRGIIGNMHDYTN
ncbi:hypothetical protein QCE73_00155 [Caballeronia sp. LZ029]|uniref:hypothetical protein n=1 Tax=Caballeronia sp. LZ029 TaxID=3038564 RepID=UPI0028558F89|nr:hypothetical protein [Caballeronia sp. LZ029]MDR5741559.1 hypothetical protein [Caballeronia sp. LZ029]